VVTLIGVLRVSERMPSASAATPALVAAYTAMAPGMPRSADTDDTTTRCPAFASRKMAIAASHCASAPTKFVTAVSRLASNRPVPMRAPLPSPALTITRSRPPSSSRAAANPATTDA
jgi:hypothetical protein